MQDDFLYEPAHDRAGFQLSATVLADDEALRDAMRDDVAMAGFRILDCCSFEEFGSGIGALGDLVLIDCRAVDAQMMALLSRLDMRVAKAGARMVVSTTGDAVEAVFGCLALAKPEYVVDDGRAQRIVAIGRVLAEGPNLRLRELAEDDRMMLLRLTEQVGRLAERIEQRAPMLRGAVSGPRREEANRLNHKAEPDFTAVTHSAVNSALGSSNSGAARTLPPAEVIRAMIRRRQARAQFFDAELFADPAWDILLDLAAAQMEGARVSVTSLCIAAAVPPTTGLRWITQMVDSGVLVRVPDQQDRRRAYIALSADTAQALARYFAHIGVGAGQSDLAAQQSAAA